MIGQLLSYKRNKKHFGMGYRKFPTALHRADEKIISIIKKHRVYL